MPGDGRRLRAVRRWRTRDRRADRRYRCRRDSHRWSWWGRRWLAASGRFAGRRLAGPAGPAVPVGPAGPPADLAGHPVDLAVVPVAPVVPAGRAVAIPVRVDRSGRLVPAGRAAHSVAPTAGGGALPVPARSR